MSNAGRGNPACPYLGLKDDADTSLAFPSGWNTCHRVRRVVSPSLEYQAEYCLGENHRTCVVFSAEQTTLPVMHQLQAAHKRGNKSGSNSYLVLALGFTGVLILIGLSWRFLSPMRTPAVATVLPSSTAADLITSLATTITFTPAATLTMSPNPPLTVAVASIRQLEQPIGGDRKFVIHKIQYGENLNQCASRYNTSIEAIVAVNYRLKTPVWVDTLVVIPFGFTDVSNLPAFEAYEVTQDDPSLKVLALRLSTTLDDLKYYNVIGADESLQVGDWLLVPHPRPVP